MQHPFSRMIWSSQGSSENMGSFLAKSTTRVMAGVMILVNSLKASRSTLSPSGMETMGDWPMSSGRNFRLCFQWLPWALVLRWASVATWIRSHSSGVGSGRCCSDRIISSFRLRSRFCSISLRLATRFESSRTKSMAMPTAMHFLKRHSWHWFRVILSMTQQLSYLQE